MIKRETLVLATYACLHCQTQRPYAYRGQEENPVLNCATCKTTQRHTFLKCDEYEITSDVSLSDSRIHSMTFAAVPKSIPAPVWFRPQVSA